MSDPLSTIEIPITRDHINKGVRHKCGECPIALAVSEKFHGEVSVDVEAIVIQYEKSMKVFQVPIEAKVFIHRFDNWGDVYAKPFVLRLKV